VSFPITITVYVTQRKESFTGEIHIGIETILMCGVSILMKQDALPMCNDPDEVFDYSGIYS
jgi:hypothetical protein